MIPGAIPISSDDTSMTSTVGPACDFEINGPLTIQALNQAAQQKPGVGQIISLNCGGMIFWHSLITGMNANLDVQQSITQAFIRFNQNRSRRRQQRAIVHDNAYIIVADDENRDHHIIKYVFRQAGQNP
uniref:Uncharacterized protein n=1 Tax=Acrobeloides nanus TaxID=290746 RepID=A0A914CD38_9BILA